MRFTEVVSITLRTVVYKNIAFYSARNLPEQRGMPL